MELESYIPELGLVPKFIRPVRPVADLYDLPVLAGDSEESARGRVGAKLSYQFGSGTAKGAYGNSPKGGVFPGTSCSTFESNQWIVVIPRRPSRQF